jgi:upstream activation factor subunit UAF30
MHTAHPYQILTLADPLPAEVAATYTVIIDEILRTSDLNTISAKRIRKGLQERIGQDIAPQKVRLTCTAQQASEY